MVKFICANRTALLVGCELAGLLRRVKTGHFEIYAEGYEFVMIMKANVNDKD